MAQTGWPEDTSNQRTLPCGCQTLRIGPTELRGDRTIITKHCDQHPKAQP